MPRAADYRTAATQLSTDIASLSTMAGALHRSSDDIGCSGTDLAASIVTGLVAATANAGDAAEQCHTLMEELERRAQLCDEYTDAINTYYWTTLPNYNEAKASYDLSRDRGGDAPWPGRRPERPAPPFPGAVHG